MKAKHHIFNILCLGPATVDELVGRTNLARSTLYKELTNLEDEGLIVKERRDKTISSSVAGNFKAQKMRDLFMKARRADVDPGRLLNPVFIEVWKKLKQERTLKGIMKGTGRSYQSVYKVVREMIRWDLIEVLMKKPLKVKPLSSDITRAYEEVIKVDEKENPKVVIEDPIISRVYTTPFEIERLLYSKRDEMTTTASTVSTGPVFLGKKRTIIYYPIEEQDTPESIFLALLMSPDGVEDACIKMLDNDMVNFDELIELAEKKRLLNILGCYLDILYAMKDDLVPLRVLRDLSHRTRKRDGEESIFLRSERKFGKGGWEEEYEQRWEVDLYIDLGAIKHTVRAL